MFFSKFAVLISLYWSKKVSRRSWLYLFVVIALTVFNVFLSVQFNDWKNAFYTALQNYDYPQLIAELILFMKLATLYILVSLFIYYLQKTIALRWRADLSTFFAGEWLREKNYYYMKLDRADTDNPDQRISEDTAIFTDKTLQFTLGLFNAVLTLISFIGILWQLSDTIAIPIGNMQFHVEGYIVWFALAYTGLGTYITHKIGKELVPINYAQQRYEADFRFSMMRLREHTVSIAALHGEAREGTVFARRLNDLLHNFSLIIKKESSLTALKSGYLQLSNVIPVLIAVPLYMGKTINLGGLMQSASAFSKVVYSLSYFLLLYNEFAAWRSVIDRLYHFYEHLQKVEALRTNTETRNYIRGEQNDALILDKVTLWTPQQDLLLDETTLTIRYGERLILEGENGIGKSTLLKALAGLWPYFSGTIKSPDTHSLLYLPQDVYIPAGTLRDIIVYPALSTNDADDLKELLKSFDLTYLADKLDVQANWNDILSLGEKQKLAFVKVLYLKPKWLILDEATANLDADSEAFVYQKVIDALPNITIISVTHRRAVEKYHNRKLLFRQNKLVVSSV